MVVLVVKGRGQWTRRKQRAWLGPTNGKLLTALRALARAGVRAGLLPNPNPTTLLVHLPHYYNIWASNDLDLDSAQKLPRIITNYFSGRV